MTNVLTMKELMLVKPFVRNVLPGKIFQDCWVVARVHHVKLACSVRHPDRSAPTVLLEHTSAIKASRAKVAQQDSGAANPDSVQFKDVTPFQLQKVKMMAEWSVTEVIGVLYTQETSVVLWSGAKSN